MFYFPIHFINLYFDSTWKHEYYFTQIKLNYLISCCSKLKYTLLIDVIINNYIIIKRTTEKVKWRY